ncbi:MAG: GTPase HflX, partial [Frankiaceae bacterium]|nr:GTPase HflX [Frankiaceae bacterium]
IDAADEEALRRLRRLAPDAAYVSARSGEGIDALRAEVESRLPRPEVTVQVLVPFDRGDLVARIHQRGDVIEQEYTPLGARIVARVHPALARRLAPFAVSAAPA